MSGRDRRQCECFLSNIPNRGGRIFQLSDTESIVLVIRLVFNSRIRYSVSSNIWFWPNIPTCIHWLLCCSANAQRLRTNVTVRVSHTGERGNANARSRVCLFPLRIYCDPKATAVNSVACCKNYGGTKSYLVLYSVFEAIFLFRMFLFDLIRKFRYSNTPNSG